MRKLWTAGLTGLILVVALSGPLHGQKGAGLWDGTQWKELPEAIKVAYIKGVGNLADYEMAASGPRAGLVCRALGEEWRTKTIAQIVQEVDNYYRQNPQKISTPVIEVVLRCCSGLSIPETGKSGKP